MGNKRSVAGSAFALGLAVLAFGSGVMAPLWLLAPRNGLPGWGDFTATTVGDTLLLPVLAASLVVAFRSLPTTGRRNEKIVIVFSGLLGAAGGAAEQLSWLMDNRPRLSWVLTGRHHFSAAGWYHAAFLCAATGLLFALAIGVAYRLRHYGGRDVSSLARSPLLVITLVCIWTFCFLVIQGHGSGISSITTAASVLVLPLATVFLCFYSFRSWTASLGALVVALILSVLLSVIVVDISAALGQKGFNAASNDHIAVSGHPRRW